MIPLTDNFSTKVEQKTNENSSVPLIVYSAYQTSIKSELAKYHHQSLWLLPVTTLIKAIKNNQLSSLPGLTQKLMASLPPSTATIKGHMHRTRQGLISTRIKHNEPDLGYKSDNMNPPHEAHSGIERKNFVLPRWLIRTRVQSTKTYPLDYQYNPYETCNTFLYVMHMNQMIFWYDL